MRKTIILFKQTDKFGEFCFLSNLCWIWMCSYKYRSDLDPSPGKKTKSVPDCKITGSESGCKTESWSNPQEKLEPNVEEKVRFWHVTWGILYIQTGSEFDFFSRYGSETSAKQTRREIQYDEFETTDCLFESWYSY